jgi:predicted RNA binding protein YcfA (HicA-like mRNA interferase family)
MSGQRPPLTCSQFENVLKQLGFEQRPMKSGTSHRDWIGNVGGRFRKVTVDPPKAPFSHDLIHSMAHQAGVTVKRIYAIHFGREKSK